MRERRGAVPPRPVQCRVCTIYIGEGYQETQPIPLPDSKGFVCWQCWQSLRRQAERQTPEPPGATRL